MAQPTPLNPRRRRRSQQKTAPAPRRQLREHRGRAWINGAEVGGADPRFSHLDRSYD